MQVEIRSAQIGRKWVAFKEDADLSEFDEAKIQTWTIDSRDCNTGTLIAVGEKITAGRSSSAFALSYNLAFAEVHAEKVSGPLSSDKPDRAFLETLPTSVLTAYVMRADPTRDLTTDEFDSLRKKPMPSGGSSTDSASN